MGPRTGLDRCGKSRLHRDSPVTSRYADYATRPTKYNVAERILLKGLVFLKSYKRTDALFLQKIQHVSKTSKEMFLAWRSSVCLCARAMIPFEWLISLTSSNFPPFFGPTVPLLRSQLVYKALCWSCQMRSC